MTSVEQAEDIRRQVPFEDLVHGIDGLDYPERRLHILRWGAHVRLASALGSFEKIDELYALEGLIGEAQLHEFPLITQTPGRETYFVPTSVGRLAVEVAGVATSSIDPAIVTEHGTPGSRLHKPELDHYVIESGARMFTYDRPGYGLSSPLPNRRPIDSARTVDTLARYFDLGQYSLLAFSGGCDHALAAAGAQEVNRVALMTPSAPLWALGERWYDNMDPSNVAVSRAIHSADRWDNEYALLRLGTMWRNMRKAPQLHYSQELKNSAEYLPLPTVSHSDNASRLNTLRSLAEGVRFYRDGWDDDIRGYDGDIDPRNIDGRKVLVCYGGKDVYTPPQHGEWLAQNIPGATGVFFPEATHREVQQHGVYAAIDWCLGKSIDLGKIGIDAVITT